MIILDTNVISELMQAEPAQAIASWLKSHRRHEFAITVINTFEIHYGLGLLPPGRRRAGLIGSFDAFLDRGFGERVLPFDESAALCCADIMITRRAHGRPMINKLADTQIAAIATVHGAAIATRDIADFDGCGVDLINPWSGSVTRH